MPIYRAELHNICVLYGTFFCWLLHEKMFSKNHEVMDVGSSHIPAEKRHLFYGFHNNDERNTVSSYRSN